MRPLGNRSALLVPCVAVGLLAGPASARVPFPVDSAYADTVRIAVLSNDIATGFCVNMPDVGPQTRDFVIAALDTTHCMHVKIASAPYANLDTIVNMFSPNLPHVIVHINAGWGYVPNFSNIMSWAALYNVGMVEIGDDGAVYLPKVFPWARLATPYPWSPMQTGTWLSDTLDKLYVRLQPERDVTLDSAAYPHLNGLLRNTVSALMGDSTLYYLPYDPYGEVSRCESDPDVYAIDSGKQHLVTFLAYQQGYNAVCDSSDTAIVRPMDITCDSTIGLPGQYTCVAIMQDTMDIGGSPGLRRAVLLAFQPQFLLDSVAAHQLVYDAVMYASLVHMSNPPAPEVGVRQRFTRPGCLSEARALAGLRGAMVGMTDMSGRVVYEGIVAGRAQFRKAVGALPVGVYLMTAMKDGIVRSSQYAVTR